MHANAGLWLWRKMRLVCLSYRVLFGVALVLAVTVCFADSTFVYKAPGDITITVTPDGLSLIEYEGKVLASGGWHAGNGESMFAAGTGKVRAGEVLQKSMRALSPKVVQVTQAQTDLTTVFTYTFDREDVTISARVENTSPKDDLSVVSFGGLSFDFQTKPEGIMPAWHVSYTRANGVRLCHPSHLCPIGGSYASDGDIGIGLTPLRCAFSRSLFMWDRQDWSGKGENDPRRSLIYVRPAPLPAGGAAAFDMKMRLSRNTQWKHLLDPYKEFFQATYGQIRYKPDFRGIVQSCISLNYSADKMTADNPYGFHGYAMLDRKDVTEKWAKESVAAIKAGSGQGMIVWGQSGSDVREAMYRTDPDVIPPAVEANWPTMVKAFNDANLHLGICMRPGEFAFRAKWPIDYTMSLSGDDPAHLEMMWRRFKRMIDGGCTIFYLDSFGNSLDHVKIMRYVRERMGPNIQCFSEHSCDVLVPYSGLYTETDYWGDEQGTPGEYRPRVGLRNWEIYQWLVPGANAVSRLCDRHGVMPKDFEPVAHFLRRNNIIPFM